MSRGSDLNELARANQKKMQEAPSKYATSGPGAKRGDASWDWAGAEDLKDAIVAVTEDGCALTFGVTSDGGALVISVLDNGHPAKRYASDMAELNEKLSEVSEIAKS